MPIPVAPIRPSLLKHSVFEFPHLMPSQYVADYYIQYREEEPDQNNLPQFFLNSHLMNDGYPPHCN